jgi:ketosteroid isomerase-like protein
VAVGVPSRTSENANLDIIKAAYDAFGRGDIAAVLGIQAPNVELEHPGPDQIPWAGSFRGLEGAKNFFAAIEGEALIEAFEPRTFVAEGDRVVVLGFERVRSKRTGRTFESHWAHSFTLVDGKIVAFREYTNTAAVAAAFEK